MNFFGEEAVVTGSISAVRRLATDIAGRPSWDPHRQEARYRAGFATAAQGWSKPVGTPPGPFTITAVQSERTWAIETGFRSAVCMGENGYLPLCRWEDQGHKVRRDARPFGPVVSHGARRT